MSKEITILIVLANFYEDISKNLLDGAINYFKNNDINFDLVTVPGALEIPQVIKFYYDLNENIPIKKYYDGYLALGCIIKGDTYHFEIVANESASSLSNLSINYSIPIANGILTTLNKEQAIHRSKMDGLNKGFESAKACIEIVKIKNKIYK